MNYSEIYVRKNNTLSIVLHFVDNSLNKVHTLLSGAAELSTSASDDSVFDRQAYYAKSRKSEVQRSHKESIENTRIQRSFAAQGNLW